MILQTRCQMKLAQEGVLHDANYINKYNGCYRTSERPFVPNLFLHFEDTDCAGSGN